MIWPRGAARTREGAFARGTRRAPCRLATCQARGRVPRRERAASAVARLLTACFGSRVVAAARGRLGTLLAADVGGSEGRTDPRDPNTQGVVLSLTQCQDTSSNTLQDSALDLLYVTTSRKPQVHESLPLPRVSTAARAQSSSLSERAPLNRSTGRDLNRCA